MNCDGEVDINDVTTLIDVVLGRVVEQFDEDAADLDHDNDISINDITALIDILLHGVR